MRSIPKLKISINKPLVFLCLVVSTVLLVAFLPTWLTPTTPSLMSNVPTSPIVPTDQKTLFPTTSPSPSALLISDKEEECTEYCNELSLAKERCPFASSNKGDDETRRCIADCIKADLDHGTDQDFIMADTLQCRRNHAKMAIKEGSLTNSDHCLSASIGSPGSCSPDSEAIARATRLNLGRDMFYYISSALKGADGDMSKTVQIFLTSIMYLSDLRGRLYIKYPYVAEIGSIETSNAIDCVASSQIKYRSVDGTCNNIHQPYMGSVNMPFGRSLEPSVLHPNGYANITQVAEILKRPQGEPPLDKLESFNQLASAWIQFMTHDWFVHDNSERSSSGALHNKVTHWWDASQIYGSSQAQEDAIRVEGGKIHLDENEELDYATNGVPRTGFTDNFWVGLHIFHTLFAREHNYIVDELSATYPDMTNDEKYGTARLCIAAIIAKIHFVEWTPTLLDNSVSDLSLNLNWYGIKEAVSRHFSNETLLAPYQGLLNTYQVPSIMNNPYGTNQTLFNTSWYITEEFVSVYRMHPLLPDAVEVDGNNFTLNELAFNDARNLLPGTNDTTKEFLKAFARTPARTLSLRNYPYELYDLALPGRNNTVNLAEIDLLRDRERNLPRYNDARRQLLLEPYKSLEELTNDEEDLKLLKSVYTDIEQVDFMVGCFADKERPEGFAFGIVPYHIFVVMASRRVYSDRFLQEGLTSENYTPWGINYVTTQNFQTLILRHFPELESDGSVPSNPFSNNWS